MPPASLARSWDQAPTANSAVLLPAAFSKRTGRSESVVRGFKNKRTGRSESVVRGFKNKRTGRSESVVRGFKNKPTGRSESVVRMVLIGPGLPEHLAPKNLCHLHASQPA